MEAIIYGASSAGRKAYNVWGGIYNVIGFVDKNPKKIGSIFMGKPVYAYNKSLLESKLIIIGTSFPDAEEECMKLKTPIIPYYCTKMLWERNEPPEGLPEIELEDKHIHNCKLLPGRTELLKNLPQNGVCMEVGVFRGDFSRMILNICHPKKLYLVDIWQGAIDGYEGMKNLAYIKERFQQEIQSGQVVIIQSDSVKALTALENNNLDWVYLDTQHDYITPRNELYTVKDKIKPNGYICGHDYTARALSTGLRYGVKDAVNEFCVLENWSFCFLTMELHGHQSFALHRIS